jgi:hypothetical protein
LVHGWRAASKNGGICPAGRLQAFAPEPNDPKVRVCDFYRCVSIPQELTFCPPLFFWRYAPKFLPRCALRAKFVRIPRSAPKQMAAPKKTANELKKARTVGSTNTIQGEQRATGSFDSWAEADGRLVRFDRITAVEELNNLGAEFVQGVLKDMIINVNYVKILVIFVYEKYATNGHSNVRKLAEMPSRRFFSLGRKPS